MCGGKHRAGSDSELLFPFSKDMKGGIPYSGTLLLSLATEKEGETIKNAVIETESLRFFSIKYPTSIPEEFI
jgi:hypothetical protein